MLLGTSQGGGVVYVEPPAAVPLNNELAAARGEAYSAADDVLFSLTGKLMGVLPEVEETYKVCSWSHGLHAHTHTHMHSCCAVYLRAHGCVA